jgi:formate hydrogenlyase transcriptional activator
MSGAREGVTGSRVAGFFMGMDSQLAPGNDARRYEVLARLAGSLASRTPEELARDLAGELRRVLDFDFLDALVYKDGSSEILWQLTETGQSPAQDIVSEETATWWVYQNQQPLIIADWNDDNRFASVRNALRAHGSEVRSFCRLPLTTPQQRLGVLGIASLQPHLYTEEDLRFLSVLADGLALIIANVLDSEVLRRTQSELEDKNARLRLLLDLTNRMTSNLDLRELLREISASVRQVMACDGVGVLLLESEGGKFRLYALDFPGSKGLLHEQLVIPSGEGLPAVALQTLKPVIQNRLDPAAYSSEAYKKVVGEGIKSNCLVPLVSRGRALGLLSLGRTNENSFSNDDAGFLIQVAGQIAIAVENALAYGEIADLRDKLAQEKLYLEDEIRGDSDFEGIVGRSAALRHVLQLAETVAPSDSTVLLLGETGTGKELIARTIHDRSRRKDHTLVRLNCAAIPTGLLESELFGHEKGAFTGAISQKIGRLELADQSTLFLDEVGDIPPEIQPKLLRALQEREFERLGSTRTKKVDVRLVAATNRDLEKMIEDREFRSDLYYRLNVFPIRIPPLRERPEDIPLLVRSFTQRYGRRMSKDIQTIPASTMKKLVAWQWPGNIRELENFVERSVILTRGTILQVPLEELTHVKRAIFLAGTRESGEREEILRVLTATNGRVAGADGAAERLGLPRTTLISRMKKLGIDARRSS